MCYGFAVSHLRSLMRGNTGIIGNCCIYGNLRVVPMVFREVWTKGLSPPAREEHYAGRQGGLFRDAGKRRLNSMVARAEVPRPELVDRYGIKKKTEGGVRI